MRIKRTVDEKEIKSILFHEDIYEHISGGHEVSANDFKLPMRTVAYIGGYDNTIFALCCIHSFLDGTKIHFNILKSHRLRYTRDFVKTCLSMVKSNIYIEFPNHRKDIFNLASKYGFDSIANNNSPTRTLMRLL